MSYLKWVGSKAKLLSFLCPLLPKTFKSYFEPFVGSGAMFFWLAQKNIWEDDVSYYLSDSNEQLINCHMVVASHLASLKKMLLDFQTKDSKEFFLTLRSKTCEQIDVGNDIEAAARFIYLNRRAWGGMWRVNQSGIFNVPFCETQTSPIVPKSINKCSSDLKKASISVSDYKDINPQSGDFVFLDPPYYPLSRTSNFTGYTPDDWTEQDHLSMVDYIDQLDKKGVKFLMTNNDCEFMREHCKKFKTKSQKVVRYIDAVKHHSKSGTSTKEKRDKVSEFFVWNYEENNHEA